MKIQNFYLLREEDETGISGTGIIAVGSIFPSGVCVFEWCTYYSSLSYFRNIDHIIEVHGHQGKTKLIMGDPPQPEEEKPKRGRPKKKKE